VPDKHLAGLESSNPKIMSASWRLLSKRTYSIFRIILLSRQLKSVALSVLLGLGPPIFALSPGYEMGNDDMITDDYVAGLLAKEASDCSLKYSSLGLNAYQSSKSVQPSCSSYSSSLGCQW